MLRSKNKKLSKYLAIFKISFHQEFAYRLNFIMWRVRNILQIFLVFFLWDAIFTDPNRVIFGYNRAKILTYILGLLFVKAFVLSARGVDIAGEISRGDISNYLLKPLNYFKYWFIRDLSSKSLNLAFAICETILLYLLLKPPFYLQTNPLVILGFIISIVIAVFIFFEYLFLVSLVPFWLPEAAWGIQFLFIAIFIEFFSGSLFPLDILPISLQKFLGLTPFPYLIFFPIQIYLGNITGTPFIKGIFISIIWVFGLWFLMNSLWRKGLRVYQSQGR